MIIIDRNKITVNQFDTCILELSLCGYKLKNGDIIEYTFNNKTTKQEYNDLDIEIPTDVKGTFDYSIVILQSGIIRTEIIKNVCEVV